MTVENQMVTPQIAILHAKSRGKVLLFGKWANYSRQYWPITRKGGRGHSNSDHSDDVGVAEQLLSVSLLLRHYAGEVKC